jgi:phycoerythrobilin:ferredoxin oxidoreductase
MGRRLSRYIYNIYIYIYIYIYMHTHTHTHTHTEEAKAYFSPNFLWTRPQEDSVVQTHVFEAFKDYLDRYLDLVEQAQPETNAGRLQEIKERQLAYLKYRAEKDPARGMFTRMYGPSWTEAYIHDFLFDLEEKMSKGLYQVCKKVLLMCC